MIQKRQLLELIQNRLNGGDAPEDVRRLYPLSVISRIVNFAYADIVSSDANAAEDMAVVYTISEDSIVSDSNGYYFLLNPKPITGAQAIYSVEDENKTYLVSSKVESKALKVLKNSTDNLAIYFGDRIRFNKQPSGDVNITMVPNIYSMTDEQNLLAPGKEMALFQMIIQLLQNPQVQDDLNNNSVDK